MKTFKNQNTFETARMKLKLKLTIALDFYKFIIKYILYSVSIYLAAELTGLMCIHFDSSSHIHFCSALWFHSEEKVWLCNSGLGQLTDCCCDCDSDRYNIPLLILVAQGRAPDASHTLSSLFCQLSSLFTIRSMQWESVAKIPAVVALNVMASPLKSIPLMPLWLKHWNTDGEREHIQLHSLEINLKDIILLDSVTVSKAGTMW